MKRSQWIIMFLCIAGLAALAWMTGQNADCEHSREELRLAEALGKIQGVGECEVFLFESQQTAFGNAAIRSAVILCEDADNMSVYLKIQQAVHTATGIGIECIDVYSENTRRNP